MEHFRHLVAVVALLSPAYAVAAEVQAQQWVSYRDAYRSMVVFEKYGEPKNLIENHLQVMPKDQNVALGDVQLTLAGNGMRINLPLDPLGRAVFPLLKSAYDDNAALQLSMPLAHYVLRPRVSIKVRADGMYELAELRAACEQVLNYRRHVDVRARNQQCVGVRFGFDASAAASDVSVGQQRLPVRAGRLFSSDPNARLRIVEVRFDQLRAQLRVRTEDPALAIAAMIE